MDFFTYRYLVLSDLYRENQTLGVTSLMKHLVMGESFKYIFWMRTCRFTRHHSTLKYLIYPIARTMLNRYRYKLSISIPFMTNIGSGFYIGHFGGIIINDKAKIGINCNISSGVTIGQTNRGPLKGCPVIGNNVFIGPGAKIIGAINIGNNVAIGANCVVTKDIPDNAVVVGIPGKITSTKGSDGYVNRTDYDQFIG